MKIMPSIPKALEPVTEDFLRRTALSRAGEGDLCGVSVSHLTLTEENLSGMALRHAEMTACRFIGCDLSGADWADARFQRCDFSGCNLSNASLRRCIFTDCKGDGLQCIDGAALEIVLENCLLDDSNIVSCAVRKAVVSRCRLRQARVAECTLGKLELEQLDCTRATIFHTPLNGLDFTDVILDGLVANPETLQGILVTRDQAADLAPLLGLRVAP